MDKHTQHILAVGLCLGQSLEGLGGGIQILALQIHLCECLKVVDIIRLQLRCLLECRESLGVVFHPEIVVGEEVVGLRSLGIDVEAVAQHLEGSGIVALLSLDHCFEKESVVTLGVVRFLCVSQNL